MAKLEHTCRQSCTHPYSGPTPSNAVTRVGLITGIVSLDAVLREASLIKG